MSSNDEYNFTDDDEYNSTEDDEYNFTEDELELFDDAAKVNYKILRREDINCRQNDDISTVSKNLSISRGAASSLLRYYNWNVDDAQDQWLVDKKGVREAIGLLPSRSTSNISSSLNNKNKSICLICLDDSSYYKSPPTSCYKYPTSCGHLICNTCWESYIRISINNGSECLSLHCPVPQCNVLVDLDLIDYFVSDEDKQKYGEHLERSYVEDSKNRKWCPAPGCDFLIEYNDINGRGTNYDVTCYCKYKFCWNCSKEIHSPADCETVKKWKLKMESETWKMANRAIVKKDSDTDRYKHYYERWTFYEKSRMGALVNMSRARTQHIDKLENSYMVGYCQLEFLINAWEQILECMRILKWSYAYGFFMSSDDKRKKLFEFSQSEAESGLEKLHYCVKEELKQYMQQRKAPLKSDTEFAEFRRKLVIYTQVTKKVFKSFQEFDVV